MVKLDVRTVDYVESSPTMVLNCQNCLAEGEVSAVTLYPDKPGCAKPSVTSSGICRRCEKSYKITLTITEIVEE